MGHFIDAESIRKALKVLNLTITSTTVMKVTTTRYYYKIFCLEKLRFNSCKRA